MRKAEGGEPLHGASQPGHSGCADLALWLVTGPFLPAAAPQESRALLRFKQCAASVSELFPDLSFFRGCAVKAAS